MVSNGDCTNVSKKVFECRHVLILTTEHVGITILVVTKSLVSKELLRVKWVLPQLDQIH